MTRQEKYPDTETFHYHNANPHNRFTSDCVIRAIATATGKPWETVVRELTELGLKYGYVYDDEKCYSKYLEREGWTKYPQPRHADNTKYTGEEFCQARAKAWIPQKPVIAHIGGHHIVAIIGAQVWDTWNSTHGCIGNYWTK